MRPARARLISRAYSTIGGIVRAAIANPAGPTVSCPAMPWRCEVPSSLIRRSIPPTRMLVKTNAAPVTHSATESVVVTRAPADIAAATPPMIGSRARSAS